MREHSLLRQPPAKAVRAASNDRVLMKPPAIGGLVPFSSVDWPGKLCAVVFLSGCPWRCGYCHNPHLHERESVMTMAAFEQFLKARQGLLDGLVISGGEPLMDLACPQLGSLAKGFGYQVALHTAGIYPDRLYGMLDRLDWVGLDIKTTPDRYDALTQRHRSVAPVMRSLDMLLEWGGTFECRTTWDPCWLPQEALLELADMLRARGVRAFAVQRHRQEGTFSSQAALSASACDTLHAMFTHFVYR